MLVDPLRPLEQIRLGLSRDKAVQATIPIDGYRLTLEVLLREVKETLTDSPGVCVRARMCVYACLRASGCACMRACKYTGACVRGACVCECVG